MYLTCFTSVGEARDRNRHRLLAVIQHFWQADNALSAIRE